MKYFIYTLQNKINNKIYVGQTHNIEKRLSVYRSSTKKRQPIYLAIKKYGFSNFEFTIIEEHCNTIDTDDAECFWIEYFQSRNNKIGYNLAAGGKVNRGMKRSQESKDKISETKKEHYKTNKQWNYGIPQTESAKYNLSQIKGEKTSRALFTNEQVKQMRDIFWNGNYSYTEFAKIHNTTARGMQDILINKYYNDPTFIVTEQMLIEQKEKVRKKQSNNTIEQFKKFRQSI